MQISKPKKAVAPAHTRSKRSNPLNEALDNLEAGTALFVQLDDKSLEDALVYCKNQAARMNTVYSKATETLRTNRAGEQMFNKDNEPLYVRERTREYRAAALEDGAEFGKAYEGKAGVAIYRTM